jgi:uncharacterized protein
LSRVFVDTSAFVALRNRAEREHEAARRVLRELTADRAQLFTSNYVFSETYTALLVRVGRNEAIEWGRRFRTSSAIESIRVDEEIEETAWSILETYADTGYSHVDATSFALIDRYGFTDAFAFDRHFVQHGVAVLP